MRALALTWDGDEESRFEEGPASQHLVVLRRAQLVDRRFNAAAEPLFAALIPSAAHAARWLSALSTCGDANRRVKRLRILVAAQCDSHTLDVVRRAAQTLEVLAVPDIVLEDGEPDAWWEAWPAMTLPSLRWLSVEAEHLDELAQLLARLQTSQLNTLCAHSLEAAGQEAAGPPQWSTDLAASLATLRLTYGGIEPVADLVNLHQLHRLRSLQLANLYAREMGPLFASMLQPAVSPTYLNLDFLPLSLKGEERANEDLARAVGQAWIDAALRLPSITYLALAHRLGGERIGAHVVLEELTNRLDIDSTWPALRRVEVGLASANAMPLLDPLKEVCRRRNIDLVPLFGHVAVAGLSADSCS